MFFFFEGVSQLGGADMMPPRDVSYLFEGLGLDFPSSSQKVPINIPSKFFCSHQVPKKFPSISHSNSFVLIKFPKNSHQIPLVPFKF
jgi:hypothetical protein